MREFHPTISNTVHKTHICVELETVRMNMIENNNYEIIALKIIFFPKYKSTLKISASIENDSWFDRLLCPCSNIVIN